jgi:hypothetical protein
MRPSQRLKAIAAVLAACAVAATATACSRSSSRLYPYITIKSDDANPCDNPATFNAQLASGKMDNVFCTYFTDAGNVISSGQSADSPSSPS